METLNRDEILVIANKLDDRSLFSFCLSNKTLCPNENFWKNRFIGKYDEKSASFKNEDRTWKNYYLLITHYDEKYTVGKALTEVILRDSTFINSHNDLYQTFKHPDLDLINFFIYKGAGIEYGIYAAARKGDKYLLNYFLENKNSIIDVDNGLLGAAEGGNKEIVDFFIDKGSSNWPIGLYGAAYSGNKELIDFFLSKTRYRNIGLYGAAKAGNKELVDFFLKEGAYDLDLGLQGAAQSGDFKLVRYFIKKGAKNLEKGLLGAADGGNKNMVYFFIEKGAKDWKLALSAAESGGHKEMINFFKKKLNL